jgi:hypothetical protein
MDQKQPPVPPAAEKPPVPPASAPAAAAKPWKQVVPAPGAPAESAPLREDGPSFEEWLEYGYPAGEYPPEGFSDKRPKVTIINQRAGAIVLKTGERIPSGSSAEVSAKDAVQLLAHRGVVDAAKLAPSLGNELEKLRKELAAVKAENAKLTKKA